MWQWVVGVRGRKGYVQNAKSQQMRLGWRDNVHEDIMMCKIFMTGPC